MNVVITGGAGFLGLRLARTILGAGELAVRGAAPVPVHQVTLLDRVAPTGLDDARLRAVVGDLAQVAAEGVAGADVVFHLASAVSGEAEADFDLGMSANLRAGQVLLEACRALPSPPVLVFASSLAVYGRWPQLPPLDVVDDATLPTPRTSYGIQKFVLEQLVTDYTRKGFLIGRSVRLMTVSVRPGRPNAAASGFLSGIVREPLAGRRAVCPVPPSTAVALSSPRRTIDGLLRAAAASEEEWGAPIAMNLPALTTTVAEMVDALTAEVGPEVAALIDWVPDPAVEAIVAGWPSRFETARAAVLGLTPEPDFRAIIRAYRSE
ncbi:SDR family oxidoreductase [Phytohabitans flavus]